MLTYLIDGVPLDDPDERWYLLAKGTAFAAPLTMRSVNQNIPGVWGELPGAAESADGAALPLRLAVNGADYDETQDRLSLLKLLLRQGTTVTRDTGDPFGLVSQPCKLVSAAEPEVLGREVRLAAVLRLPSVTWRAAAPDFTAGPGTFALPGLAGSTEAIRDATITVTGPATNPTLTDVASGAWLQWAGALPAGAHLRLLCAQHSADTGGVAVTAALRFGPQPPAEFLPLTPALTLDTHSTQVRLRFAATGTTTATRLTVHARKAVL